MYNCVLKFATPIRVSVMNGTTISKELENIFEQILGDKTLIPGAEMEVSTEITIENTPCIPTEKILEQLAQTINENVTNSFNNGSISANVSGKTKFLGYTKISEK